MSAEGEAAYTTFAPDSLLFRPANLDDLDRIAELEEAGYPVDEMASKEQMEYRIANAPELFMVATTSVGDSQDQIVGYVCGTRSTSERLQKESMSTHAPDGTVVCIHSVCVDENLRQKGIATRMLSGYLRMATGLQPSIKSVRLICKAELVTLYEIAGFYVVGPSAVQHGKDEWIEMAVDEEEMTAMYG